MKGVVSTQAIDGDVAFNINAAGAATRAPAAAARARRMESLAHPVVFVHMALNPKSTVSNRRTSAGLELVDVTTPLGDALTLAVHPSSSLPAWVSWVGPDGNLGDVTYRAAFTGYAAGERRADADRPQHDDRLPVDRAEQALCRSTGHRCAHRRPVSSGGGAGRAGARAAGADHRGDRRSPRASGSCAAPATRCCSSSTIT